MSFNSCKMNSSARMLPLTLSRILKYAGDWGLSIFCLSFGLYLETVTPFERYIIPDQTISYPFTFDEKVPPVWLPFIGILLPVLIIILTTFFLYLSVFFRYSRVKYQGKLLSKFHWTQYLHLNILGLFMSVSCCYLTTNILKITCGRLRPDFIDRCKPKSLVIFPIICTGNVRDIFEGRKSFPSGHTSSKNSTHP